ncbi:unnamed protein product [Closterium sp. NIES-64]|nr:unnamed protein product [Closterium sp. NIES-64]
MAASMPVSLSFLSLLLLLLVLAASSAAVNGEEYESNFCDRYVRYLGLTCREYQLFPIPLSLSLLFLLFLSLSPPSTPSPSRFFRSHTRSPAHKSLPNLLFPHLSLLLPPTSSLTTLSLFTTHCLYYPLPQPSLPHNPLACQYHCATSQVTTVDGYILNFQRILNATAYNASISAAAAAAAAAATPAATTAPTTTTTRSSSSSSPTPYPVLLDHGLILGGELWFGLSNVTVDPIAYKRLPVILANRGMDVWVVNHRCTEYSPRHVTYTTEQWQYWDWDFDQLVQFDLPAVLRVITTVTASPKVHLVGYNQGAMLPFALASTYPEYTRQTIASVAAIAPIAYLVNITSPVLDAWANNWSPDIFFYQNHLLNGAYNLTATEVLVSTLRRVGFNFYTVFTPSGNVQDILSNVTGPICCMDPYAPLLALNPQWVATSPFLPFNSPSTPLPPLSPPPPGPICCMDPNAPPLALSTPCPICCMDPNAPPLALNPQWVATSYRALIHYQQEIRDRQFQLWDFLSAQANTANYGSSTPPLSPDHQHPSP